MATENLHFSDDHHLTDVAHSLDKLRMQQELCDIQLIADDGSVNAHKILLAVSSGYMRQMLKKNGTADLSSHRIEGVDRLSLEAIIDFIYSGTINITPDQVLPIFHASNKLQVTSISEACSNYLQLNIDLSNCLHIRTLAGNYRCHNLTLATDEYIRNNMEQLVRSEAFLHLPQIEFEVYIDQNQNDNSNQLNGEDYAQEIVNWLCKHGNLLQRQKNRLRESVLYLFSIQTGELTDIDNLNNEQLNAIEESIRCKALKSRTRNLGLSSPRASSPTPSPRDQLTTQTNPLAVAARQLRLSPQDNLPFDWHIIAVGETSDAGFIVLVSIDDGNLISVSFHLKSTENLLRRSSSNCSNGSINMSLLGSMQCGRCSLGTAVLNNEVYAIGGYDRVGCLNVVERYNPVSNKWVTCHPVNHRNGRIAAAASSDHVYAIGGSHASHDLRSCERYDPLTDCWKALKSMRTPRSCLGAEALKDRIFAIGGQNDEGSINNVEMYDIESNAWINVKSMNAARSNLGVTAVLNNEEIYAVGGCDKWSSVVSSAERYDASNDIWNPIPNMKLKRRGAGVAAYEGLLYVCGGSDGSQPLDSVECFDPRANKWILLKEHMNRARVNVGVVAVNGWIYAIGGFDGSTFLNSIERFNPSTKIWTSIVTDDDSIEIQ